MTQELKDDLFAELIALLGRVENELDTHYSMEFLKDAIDTMEKDREFLKELCRTDKTLLRQ